MTKPARPLFLLAVVSLLVALACSVVVKRDLSTIPQGQVGFDDMCGLQDYFDALDGKVAKEPAVVSSLDLEGGDGKRTVRGGKARLVFQGEFLLKHGRRVLQENFRRLPEELATADKFELEVRWAEKAGVRRVVTDEEPELFIGNDSWALPYHVCLSEFLYGAPLYRQRRALWGLPSPVASEDGGAPKDAGASAAVVATSDGGAARDAGAALVPRTDAAVSVDSPKAAATPEPAPPLKSSKRSRHGK